MTAPLFLAAYHFDGDPRDLLLAYDRLMAGFPPEMTALHVCVERPGGISIYDACPSRADFESFSTSGEFLGAVAAAGLPAPRVVPVGDVRSTRIREGATR